MLADAPQNACTTINFAAGVSTITVASQLTPPAMTLTIDGGSGVTISGGNATRVWWVNAGTNVTFAGLTITAGNAGAGEGGGIYNNGGTVTIASNATVSGNTATSNGGGIYLAGGTITLGSGNLIQNNTVNAVPPPAGGGIWLNVGTMISGIANYGSGNTPDNCMTLGPPCP